MSNSRVNAEVELLLEQPFARVPYENYRKVFRASQKQIEKDFGPITSSASALAEISDPVHATASLDSLISRVEELKKKLADLHGIAGTSTVAVLRERVNHLSTIDTLDSKESIEAWNEQRLDRWIVDWALRHGRTATSQAISEAKGIQSLVDLDLFAHVQSIEQALRNHSCSEALAWCSDNKQALRKAKLTLELDLRLQEYIELARARKTQEAIAYSKKHFTAWQGTHFVQLTQAAALLAFPPTTTCAPYKRLYDTARWYVLIQSFRLAFFSIFSLPSEPLLHLALFGGLSALKLPACDTENCVDCPACSQPLAALASHVPRAHHLNSTVVCAISGCVMDADNPPMAFPNGYIYSRKALEEMAEKNNGRVTCPRSGVESDLVGLRKVFVS